MSANKIILITLFLSIPFCISCGMLNHITKTTNFYSIREIKQGKAQSNSFYTEGYVAKIYTCPPCPKDARCKMCMARNIVISEGNITLKSYYLTDTELIIFTNKIDEFNVGQKYKFFVKMLNYKNTSEPINNVELINYEVLK